MPVGKNKLTASSFLDISLSPKQKEYSETIFNNTITFCWGPAGSSKTFSACYTALRLLQKGVIEKIIFTKPIQESGEKLGSLPGDVGEKIGPYMESFLITMEKIIKKDVLTQLINDKVIEFRPLAYMRGATFDECLISGEKILTNKGYITVDQIFEDASNGIYHIVITSNPKGELEEKELDAISMSLTNKYICVELENGSSINVTDSHKFYTSNRGIVEAKDLTEEDDIIYYEM